MPQSAPQRVAIALGANLGSPRESLELAAERLRAGGVSDTRVSDWFRTEPVGCVPGTPPFLNRVLVGHWSGTPLSLLDLCQGIEAEFGRPTVHSQREARVLDLDIVLFGGETVCHPRLVVPHPRMSQRLFVLVPLAQLAADWVVPGTAATVGELLERELREQGESWGERVEGEG